MVNGHLPNIDALSIVKGMLVINHAVKQLMIGCEQIIIYFKLKTVHSLHFE